MHNTKIRTVARYVFPTMLSNFCFVLFAIIDAIFVGRGVGTNALGAINLVNPFVCKEIIDQLPEVMVKYGIHSLKEIIGGAHHG